jgi:hypothetical protein
MVSLRERELGPTPTVVLTSRDSLLIRANPPCPSALSLPSCIASSDYCSAVFPKPRSPRHPLSTAFRATELLFLAFTALSGS